MKIKNIAFSGFAAAIFATVCGAASAAESINLASKGYVDSALDTKANLSDLEILESTVGKKATQEALKVVADQVDINTGDIALLKDAGYQTSSDVQAALSQLQSSLTAAINEKQDKGDFAQASDLKQLESVVSALEAGAADKAEFETLQAAVGVIAADYAKKTELTATEQSLRSAIAAVQAAIPTKVSAFENDANYVKADELRGALTDYATNQALNSLQDVVDANSADIKDNADAIAGNAQDIISLNTAVQSAAALGTGAGEAAAAAQKTADEAKSMANLNAEDIVELQLAGYQDADAVQASIKTATDPLATKEAVNAALALKADASSLATVATTGKYSDLKEIPTDLVNMTKLNEVQQLLQDAIDAKQAGGDYATAAQLSKVQEDIASLQSGKAELSTVQTLQQTVNQMKTDYATDEELSAVQKELDDAVQSISNDYVLKSDLGALAYKSMVATADINNAAVTPAKLQGAVPADGEKMFMSVDNAGNAEWVSVKIY